MTDSLVYFVAPGDIKRGDYVMIKDAPCKAEEVTHSKVGKHGSAKTHIVGNDIFTGKRYEHTWSGSQLADVPYVKKTEYILIDLNDSRDMSLMLNNGETRDDLSLDDESELYNTIRERMSRDEELIVTVLSAMGIDKAVSVKSA